MRNALVLLSFALMLVGLPLPGNSQVTFIFDPQVDQSRVDFDLWNRVVVPVHDRLTLPYGLSALRIQLGNSTFAGTIIISNYPRDKANLNDNFYVSLTHEYGHTKFPCDGKTPVIRRDGLLEEGSVEAARNLTYRELARTIPGILALTDLFHGDVRDNMPVSAVAGAHVGTDPRFTGVASAYYGNLFLYDSVAARFEVLANKLPGKNLRVYYETVERLRPQNGQEYLVALDVAAGGEKVDGVAPSTFFQKSSASFLNGPDGTFFGLKVFGEQNRLKWSGGLQPPINPGVTGTTGGITVVIRTRENGLPKPPEPITSLEWEVKNVFGAIVASRSQNNGSIQINGWPNGAYKVSGCTPCTSALRDTTYFAVYRQAWEEGKVFIFGNGPEFGDFNAQTQLRLVNPPSGVSTETLPGWLVVNLNGSTHDLVVTDGRKTRVITPDWEVSRFVYFTERDQPYLYTAANGASFTPGALVPGSIATLWTWAATQTDPEQSQTLPLPASSCRGLQGNTRVVFSANGRTFEAPFFYCSRNQLNVQVPWGLAGYDTVAIKVVLNNTPGNEISMPVRETDPGIFVVDPTQRIGAVISQDGRIVDSQNPALAGHTLSLFATGLAAVDPPPPGDALPAPSSPLSLTLNTPTVLVDGMPCQVSFSGLAPGFVGLYQVNFVVPQGLPAGTHDLELSVRNSSSNTVKLVTR